MSEYHGRIIAENTCYTRPELLAKWLKKNNGKWFKAVFSIPAKDADPKTAAQLGYYWGLLLPEITKQLIAEGHTMPVRAFGIEKDIPFNQDATHELLTALCGHVGSEGKHLRLSECGKHETIKFIDNVIEFAVANLGMNEAKLAAWRPE